MEELVDAVRARLQAVFSGRPVILARGVAASAVRSVDQLRALGATRFLVLSSGAGTGGRPEGPDVELLAPFEEELAAAEMIAGFRVEERMIRHPAAEVLDAIGRFDPRGDAIVLVLPFLDVRSLGARRVFGARRSEWVAVEDKTIADGMFDTVGVPRPPAVVVAAEAASISDAAAAIDRGAGTVWSADAREGFNGGGACVRWVRDGADRQEALDHLLPRCDRVRVATFVEGVPCSIHGFVVEDGIAVFRPVELVTLRAPAPPRLRYSGCATFFDPSAAHLATMRAAARRVGEHLRSTVGFRGAFTVDGIASTDGWVATECNPRFGAGLGYVGVALPGLHLQLLHHAVVEGAADVPSADLERVVVEAGARTRWGGAWIDVGRQLHETSSYPLVGGVDGFRRASAGESADAILETGPARGGSLVRLLFDAVRTPSGPSIAARAVAGFAYADRALDLGLGPFAPAAAG